MRIDHTIAFRSIITIVKGAKKKLIGKKIKSVEIRVPKMVNFLVKEFKKGSIGAEIKDIRRFAKIIVIDLSNGNSILIHLKLTGQLVYAGPSKIGQIEIEKGGHPSRVYDQPLPHNYTHVIFKFNDKSHLYYNDIRKFGYLKLVKTAEMGERPEIKNLGPEPLDGWKYEEFKTKLARRERSKIKQVLMDQKFVSGIGNIYANEIMFYARISPDRLIGTLTEEEKKKVFKGIQFILKKGIELGGSSENTYVNLEGKKGDFMKYARVYQQKVCKICVGPIKRINIGGRGTFYCPSCQV
ncbi:MAG: bifunctional DNA-formamidopyrimidine glycosylase/DNA-(apurinic or apyrimidinic site) lyase [Candidatus Berkelbacteria bacterium]|nr:bifunctional DNA-formamidopyrimidine glycosylase/DNA-(apurinic or apyrimidinic site) lyase [Candidatus Berkelbacteria bacterium]